MPLGIKNKITVRGKLHKVIILIQVKIIPEGLEWCNTTHTSLGKTCERLFTNSCNGVFSLLTSLTEGTEWSKMNTDFETLTYIYHIFGPSLPEFIWIWGPVQAIQQIPGEDVCPKTCKSNHMGKILNQHVNCWLFQLIVFFFNYKYQCYGLLAWYEYVWIDLVMS